MIVIIAKINNELLDIIASFVINSNESIRNVGTQRVDKFEK